MLKKILFGLAVVTVVYFAFLKGVFEEPLNELNQANENASQEYEKIQANLQAAKEKVEDTVETLNSGMDQVKNVGNTGGTYNSGGHRARGGKLHLEFQSFFRVLKQAYFPSTTFAFFYTLESFG